MLAYLERSLLAPMIATVFMKKVSPFTGAGASLVLNLKTFFPIREKRIDTQTAILLLFASLFLKDIWYVRSFRNRW